MPRSPQNCLVMLCSMNTTTLGLLLSAAGWSFGHLGMPNLLIYGFLQSLWVYLLMHSPSAMTCFPKTMSSKYDIFNYFKYVWWHKREKLWVLFVKLFREFPEVIYAFCINCCFNHCDFTCNYGLIKIIPHYGTYTVIVWTSITDLTGTLSPSCSGLVIKLVEP